jgi:hypothetical protein
MAELPERRMNETGKNSSNEQADKNISQAHMPIRKENPKTESAGNRSV